MLPSFARQPQQGISVLIFTVVFYFIFPCIVVTFVIEFSIYTLPLPQSCILAQMSHHSHVTLEVCALSKVPPP